MDSLFCSPYLVPSDSMSMDPLKGHSWQVIGSWCWHEASSHLLGADTWHQFLLSGYRTWWLGGINAKVSVVTIQYVYKWMVQFQKLTRNIFLTLHGHNVHRQQQQLSKFLMRYQQFTFHACCGVSLQDGAAAGKGFLCAPFWGVQICDYSAVWVSCTV